MNYYNHVITIATLALYTFIFSLFMLPAVKNLKQIQSKLRWLIKPIPSIDNNEAVLSDETKKQVKMLGNTLKEYKLEYHEVHKFKQILIWGIIASILAMIILFFTEHMKLSSSLVVTLLYVIIITALILYAFYEYIPPLSRITERRYMIKHFDFSPIGIARCANIHIYYNPIVWDRRDKDLDSKLKQPRHIRICSRIELRWYIYWICIYNKDTGECIFSTNGKVDSKSKLLEAYVAPELRDYNYRSIKVWEFDLYKFKDRKLEIVFFIFDPATPLKNMPYRWYHEVKFEDRTTFSSNRQVYLKDTLYQPIKYEGGNLKIKSLYRDDETKSSEQYTDMDRIIRCIFHNYRTRILKNA